MGLTVKDSGGNFTPAPEGTHVARCVQLIDLGTHYDDRWKKTSHLVLIGWELPDEMRETEDGDKPHLVWQRYTASLSEKAKLRQHLESWRGRKFTKEELKGFNLKDIVSVPCMLTIVHSEKDGSVYANINSVTSMPKGLKCPEQKTDTIVFDIASWDQEIFDGFSEKLQTTISTSQERQAMMRDKRRDDTPDFDAANAEAGSADDDIPF